MVFVNFTISIFYGFCRAFVEDCFNRQTDAYEYFRNLINHSNEIDRYPNEKVGH